MRLGFTPTFGSSSPFIHQAATRPVSFGMTKADMFADTFAEVERLANDLIPHGKTGVCWGPNLSRTVRLARTGRGSYTVENEVDGVVEDFYTISEGKITCKRGKGAPYPISSTAHLDGLLKNARVQYALRREQVDALKAETEKLCTF